MEANWSGAVPCLESAVLELTEIKNSPALKEAVDLYKRQMEQELPTETTQDLLELHTWYEEQAMRLLMEQASEESREQFRAELKVQLKALKEHFRKQNERASHKKCTAALQELFQDLDRQFKDGVYFMAGGYPLFQRDLEALVEQYRILPGKGVKAEAALQDFLQKREVMAKTIRKLEHELTEKEEQIKNLKAQIERAEVEREAERKREHESFRDGKPRQRKQREEEENMNDYQSKDQKKSTGGSNKNNPEDEQNSKGGGKSGDDSRWKMFFEFLEKALDTVLSLLSRWFDYKIMKALFTSPA
nr:guanylate-binding protein 1-like [Anas platyrhynchos]